MTTEEVAREIRAHTDGPHPCHGRNYTCGKPATQRFYNARTVTMEGEHLKFQTTDTWACNECWAEFTEYLDENGAPFPHRYVYLTKWHVMAHMGYVTACGQSVPANAYTSSATGGETLCPKCKECDGCHS
jgi:hypothetical protein